MTSFIGIYKIDKSICDNLITLFNSKKEFHCAGGVSGGMDKKIKISTELIMNPSDFQNTSVGKQYLIKLQNCLEKYKKEYDESDLVSPYRIKENIKIQYYKPGEAFYGYHKENNGAPIYVDRHLVYMTYLNNVTDKGGTQFKYQNKTFKAKKGDTLIWPSGWTHTHRGVVSQTQEKYIITGWWSFL